VLGVICIAAVINVCLSDSHDGRSRQRIADGKGGKWTVWRDSASLDLSRWVRKVNIPARRPAPKVRGQPSRRARYVKDPMSGAHVFATEADAEAARRSGEEAHKLQDMQTIGRE
jgi:hypothetical protein